MLSGCGGGNKPGGNSNPYITEPNGDIIIPQSALHEPAHDSTKPTAIGGTVSTLADSVIDHAYSAEVFLTRLPDTTTGSETQAAVTHTVVRGGYNLPNLTEGRYRVDAYAPTRANPQLTGTISDIQLLGNIPQLMENLLIGPPDQMATIHGIITQNSNAVPNASVTLDITANDTQYLQNGGNAAPIYTILSYNANSAGIYDIQVPVGAISYIVVAHSDSSMIKASSEIKDLKAGESRQVDIQLVDAESPVFSPLVSDVVASTLEKATVQASQQAMITRFAAVRAMHGSPERLTRLEQLANARQRRTRSVGGMVENDIYWDVTSNDVGVCGYHIYRSTSLLNPFIRIGDTQGPYYEYYFDNDPVLQIGEPAFYSVTCFAANGKSSAPSPVIFARPLAPIVIDSPQDGTITTADKAILRWEAVPGALSYLVLVFKMQPTYNTLPFMNVTVQPPWTYSPITGLPPGDYWWSVTAYNSSNPMNATAGSFSMYRKVTISE